VTAARRVPALRQAMTRLLFDPAYVARVYAGPVDDLTEPERALLTAVDRRAWGTDRYRRSRGAQALIEEYPVTTAVLGVGGVDAYFSSAAFARVLSDRGSLALSFGLWAQARGAADVARLERAVALARRAERPDGPGLVTRPGVEPLTLPGGVLDFYAALRRALGPNPVEALAHGRAPVPLPAPNGDPDALLVERDAAGEVQVGGGSAALVTLLTFTLQPRPRDAVLARARGLGCDPGDDAELVDELLSEGLLVHRPPVRQDA
jgi:stage V sporulation protein SpoVS